MKPHIHYEAAFEDYLRSQQIPFVAVDEAKRAAFRDAKLKSFDFIVYSANTTNWLVDVKGRRWATRKGHRKPAWENWVTEADLEGLQQWQEVFGAGFRALLGLFQLPKHLRTAIAEETQVYTLAQPPKFFGKGMGADEQP